jgi:hypothetical protein
VTAASGRQIRRRRQRGSEGQALPRAIFKAFDREEEHLYEFNCGKGPYDRSGPRYTLASNTKDFMTDDVTAGKVAKTTLDALNLEVDRAFGYWFDFGDDWRARNPRARH